MDISYEGCEVSVDMIPTGPRSGAPPCVQLHVADTSGVQDKLAECTLYLSPDEARDVARRLIKAANEAFGDQLKN